MVFALQKLLKTIGKEWFFAGCQKSLQFKFKYFFTFPQKIKNISGKENPGNILWGN